MADLTITAANVERVSGATEVLTSGVSVTAGKVLRINPSTQKAALAGNDSELNAVARGIALNDAAANQPVTILRGGDLDLGATLTVGETYVLSASGNVSPIGDMQVGDWVTILGVATAADNLRLDIQVTGVQKA